MAKTIIQNKYSVIGIMSGTSLDGLDVAHCQFEFTEFGVKYQILNAETYSYSGRMKNWLTSMEKCSVPDFFEHDRNVGVVFGNRVASFIKKYNIANLDAICSHGHTIFHQPEKGFTVQVGNGASIAAKTGQTVICDFRSVDVAHGGQGAPLVPIGDRDLFSEYNYCVNLGGISNISKNDFSKGIHAFDICPTNMILNYLANKFDREYDNNGEIGKWGAINDDLLRKLNDLPYYKLKYPKSLGKEWFLEVFLPIIEESRIGNKDKMRTAYEHIAIQISNVFLPQRMNSEIPNVLFTGGGALNTFLMDLITKYLFPRKAKVIIPSPEVINFKEALIFAYLGVLRLRGEANALKTVTGASQNTVGGCIYF